MTNQVINPGLKRRQSLAELIKKRLAEDPESDSMTFDIKDLIKLSGIKNFDDIKRTLEKMSSDLKPDFQHEILSRGATSSAADFDGSKPSSIITGIKIIVEDRSVLDDYPSNKKVGGPSFDASKSRLFVRGTEIKIQKFSDQYHALRIIFQDPKEVGKEWFFSEIGELVDKHKPDDKTYYNAIYQIRQKLKSEGFPEFFITTRHSAQINPKYLS